MKKQACALILGSYVLFAQTPARAGWDPECPDCPSGPFLLGGTARHATDPTLGGSPDNDVVRIDTFIGAFQCTAPLFENCPSGTVSRSVGVRIEKLDNMIELKYLFLSQAKTCAGGSPRIQMAIDLDGDGVSDGNVHGNLGPGPFGSGCQGFQAWTYVDLTDGAPRWDVTQIIGPGEIVLPAGQSPFLVSWFMLESLLVTQFPNHRVCTVALVDESFGAPFQSGAAYYDLFSAGRATWVDRSDTAGRGFARGCGQPDCVDDNHDGDHDKDHDKDDDDEEFDRNRKEGLNR